MNRKNKIEILFFSAFIFVLCFYIFNVNNSVVVHAITSSSSSGILTHTSSSSGILIHTSSSSGSLTHTSSSGGNVKHTSSSSGSLTSSSSGSIILLNSDFNGIWKEIMPKVNNSSSSSSGGIGSSSSGRPSGLQIPMTNSSSSSGGTTQNNGLITLKLCLENGRLAGNVQNITPGAKGEIISQNIISEDKAELTLQNKDKTTNKIKITLINSRGLKCKIEDGRTFNAKKINTFKQCSNSKSL